MKAVLFDFGGTLDSDGLTWGDRFFPLYREAGLSLARDAFDKAFFKSDDNLPTRFDLKGKGLEQTVALQVGCVLETLAPERQDLASGIARRFIEGCRGAIAKNRPVLRRLAALYPLGIVSNFYGNLREILDSEGLLEFFGVVADSHTLGIGKPDKGIFLHATDKLGVQPGEALMVGDSIRRDMKGAEDLSMPHALITQSPHACCTSGWIIRDLAELEARLI